MKWKSLCCLCLAAACAAPVSSAPPSEYCARLEQQRERIYRQLRRGYSIAQGNRLRERLREIEANLSRNCR